jgi:carbonic anhydrase/acetyltransferase-like protein (isoleucine patch superfamily)
MLIIRNGKAPSVDATARVADTAHIIGDVTIGAASFVDHQVVIESAGPPVHIGEGVVIFPGSVIRSVGGRSRPAFDVVIGSRTLIGPQCTLTGCRIGHHCYLATAAIVLQNTTVGDYSRIGIGAIVHASVALPDRSRIGLRHVAVPTGEGFLSTADVEDARQALGAAGFFGTAFGVEDADAATLHDQVMAKLLEEVHGWADRSM